MLLLEYENNKRIEFLPFSLCVLTLLIQILQMILTVNILRIPMAEQV